MNIKTSEHYSAELSVAFHYEASLHNNYRFHSGPPKDYKTTSAMKDDQKLYVIKQLFAGILLQILTTLLDMTLDQYSFVIMSCHESNML